MSESIPSSTKPVWAPLIAAVALAAAAWMPGARASDPIDLLVGDYRFVGGEKETREVERAIDEAVDEMNVFIRGIARRRLKEPNMPTETLQISADEGMIAVARSGQPTISAPASGKPITWKNPRNGNELEVTHRIKSDGNLEQKLVGDRGVSTNSFSLRADGRMLMTTTVKAEKLPSDIRFSTTYARK